MVDSPRELPDDNWSSSDRSTFEILARMDAYEDIFDTPTIKKYNNDIDIGSHYNFSPERLRLFRNGSRSFPQYNTIPQFTDAADTFQLQPDGGDTMRIETAESATYVVNYTSQHSIAFGLNQSLQPGDELKVGSYNGTDGWYLEQRGADHTDTQFDIVKERGGTRTVQATDLELSKPTTEFTRIAKQYIWYNVGGGGGKWEQTYGEDGTVKNDVIAEVTTSGDGPETGNLNAWAEITADSGTSELQMDVGSMAINTLGGNKEIVRNKPQRVKVTLGSTNDTWLPVYAVRIDPNNREVNARLQSLDVLTYDNNADIEMVVASVDESKTDATGFSAPEYHHQLNSVLEDTTNVSEVPNTSGTQTVLGSNEKFGGYTVATASLEADGSKRVQRTTDTTIAQEKKNVLSSDVVVFFARTPNAGAEVVFTWGAVQVW